MGLLASIHNFFNQIISFFKTKKLIRKYNNYFKRAEEFSSLTLISETISQDITVIYNILKSYNVKKYQKVISRYDNFLPRVKQHNQKVLEINQSMTGFDYQAFIDNPLSHTVDEINTHLQIVNKINYFSKKEKAYVDFCDEVLDLKNNFEVILEQYKLKQVTNDILNFDDNYIDSLKKEKIKLDVEQILSKIKHSNKQYYDFSKIINIDSTITEYNNLYVFLHKEDAIFNDVRGKSLDSEQREAILREDRVNLVIAGAGSGKTLTICGKVKFLLKEKKINPQDMLVLSESKKSADDRAAKVHESDERVTVGTFHKLGLDILKDTENKIFDVEEQYNAIIESYFRDELKNRPEMLMKVLCYFGIYLSSLNDQKSKSEGEMYESLKKANIPTLKNLTLNKEKKETIKKEYVKSFEELAIANFYFINGIDYEYERPYEKNVSSPEKRQYKPDFYLPKYKIYHEHYGIDKDGNASQYDGEEAKKYVEGVKWKRELHIFYNTTCLETFSYDFNDGTIFQKLKKKLVEHGVEFRPLSNENIMNALYSIYDGQNFKSFINLVRAFLSLYKARYSSDEQFDNFMNYTFKTGYERKRTKLFLYIVKDIYQYYMNHLHLYKRIDFDDMILKSKEALNLTDKFTYKYIIVDEFQDISYSRMLFLKALINKGNSKLFAVGDDWQAIYRFSGCDLNIFLHFSDYFENAQISFITSTHRNSQELQDIAGTFIKKNPEQFNKTIKSVKHLENPIKIMYYRNNKYEGLFDILKSIHDINNHASVLILGRNNKDIESFYNYKFYKCRNLKQENDYLIISKDFPTLHLKYSTVHSSKGLEDEFVIIINADDDTLGFPNQVEDDQLLNLVLSSQSNFEYAEERRLWYVALTRTKTYTYILVSASNPSIFVEEIKDKCEILNPELIKEAEKNILCPSCKTGKLIIKSNAISNRQFYGCSNYPYCQYTIDNLNAVKKNLRCPLCGDFLVVRKGKYSTFYGCHNYPKCTYATKYFL